MSQLVRIACLISLVGCAADLRVADRDDEDDSGGLDEGQGDSGDTCKNHVRDGREAGIDCGGSCPDDCTAIFDTDADTLAIFELDGDTSDSSGHRRDATLVGGSFVPTAWGKGLELAGAANQGLAWSGNAGLLAGTYTIEMVVTPRSTACYQKLFSPDDTADVGWYLCSRFTAYPEQPIGPTLSLDHRYHVAIVSSGGQLDVFVDGNYVGTTPAGFTSARDAIFFRDDTQTERREGFAGVVDAIRISKRARSAAEIELVNRRLRTQP